jgi:transposase
MNAVAVSLTRRYTASATKLSGVSIASSNTATRYEKKAENYLAMMTLASIMLWL